MPQHKENRARPSLKRKEDSRAGEEEEAQGGKGGREAMADTPVSQIQSLLTLTPHLAQRPPLPLRKMEAALFVTMVQMKVASLTMKQKLLDVVTREKEAFPLRPPLFCFGLERLGPESLFIVPNLHHLPAPQQEVKT